MTITWIIRLGHCNILLCETNMDNVKEYVIHPKESFKHRPIGQQRLVLFRRQKRKPQAYPNHVTVQKVMPGSESSTERCLLPLPIRKWRESKKFVNSGNACYTEICFWSWVKEEVSEGGGECVLAVWCSYFLGTVVSPHTATEFLSEQRELHLSRRNLQKIKSGLRENTATPLHHP